MDVYTYCAALYCEECISEIKLDLPTPQGADIEGGDESTWESDEYPKGPYSDGGGEADCPQNCDKCQLFLENPLTADGYMYLIEAQTENPASKAVREWLDFYPEVNEQPTPS